MKRINLITSTYNDLHKFTWRNLIDFSEIELFLYQKVDSLEIGQSFVDGEFINIPNYGSCDYAFFYHIVKNYNNLADINIFTKMNWIGDFENMPDIFQGCKNFDFYQCGGVPQSQIWYDGNIDCDISPKYPISYLDTQLTKDKKQHNPQNTNWTGLEYEYAGNADSQVDWFVKLFGNLDKPQEICTYERGPCFSVSRELIMRHPLSTYEYFLNIFHPFNSWNFEIASKFWNTDDIKFQTWSIGRHYHDNLLRFYRALFTFGIDENKYKIQKL